MSTSRSPIQQLRDTPFGYAFEPAYPSYPSPPAPAPGQALLDDAESSMLGDFFDKISSSTFDNTFFYDRNGPQHADTDMLYGWGEDQPPMFHGTTTSLPSQSMLSHSRHDSIHSNHMMVTPESLPATSTSKALSSTPTLTHDGRSEEALYGTQEVANILVSASNGQPSAGISSHAPAQGLSEPVSDGTPLTGPRHEIIETFNNFAHKIAPGHTEMEYFPAEILQDQTKRNSMARTAAARKANLEWGSDNGFLGSGYVPPSGQETLGMMEKDLIEKLECLVPDDSGGSGPPSPLFKRPKQRKARLGSSGSVKVREDTDDEGDDDRARRRRTGTFEDEVDYADDATKGKSRSYRGSLSKVKGSRIRKPSESSPPAKRRKSQVSASQKPNRENLTEAQKRENHIHSEQKRRNLIKQGFDDLCDLVPDLKGGGFSKSAVLVQSADWLETLLKGNERLKTILANLEMRNGS